MNLHDFFTSTPNGDRLHHYQLGHRASYFVSNWRKAGEIHPHCIEAQLKPKHLAGLISNRELIDVLAHLSIH